MLPLPRSVRRLGLLPPVLGLLAGCSRAPSDLIQGYVEGELVYVGAPLGGTLQERPVERGQALAAGDPLFVLEHGAESAAVDQAERELAKAQATVADMEKGLRPTEIASLEARLDEAHANASYWDVELEREQSLFDAKAVPAAELDMARTQRDASHAAVAALQADVETGGLGGRPDAVRAAKAAVEAARATVARAQWALDQKTRVAPLAGTVQDTLYRVGEYVPAGYPVVSILAPEYVKVRFFVPEPRLAALHPGTRVEVQVDGEPAPRGATVSFIATESEFTPPVIYSREIRSKLVTMVEARLAPEDARALKPGQPVDVRLPAASPPPDASTPR